MYDIFGFMLPFNPYTRHKIKKQNYLRNYMEYRNWLVYLINLYLNMFQWNGLPDTVDIRRLEQALFFDGKALFFNDKNFGYLALPCSPESGYNVYYEPVKYRAIGMNYSEAYSIDNSVLIRENQANYPPFFMISSLAEKIADAGRSIDVYAKSMKRPFLITCSKDDELTQRIVIDEIENNELVVVGDKRINNDNMRAYGNGQDGQGLLALWRHKHELLDEIMTFMGINNANTEKRERLITAEVESNNQLVQLNIDTALDWRKKACEDINKMFGLSCSVNIKHDYIKESANNGQVHNDNKGNT